jgi:hypothetical protein
MPQPGRCCTLTGRQPGATMAAMDIRLRSSREPYHPDSADVLFAAIVVAAVIGLFLLIVL